MRATGRILRVTGTGRIPQLSATARMVQGQLAPAAQLARIADAVEVWDPSGILTLAEDTDDGVRIVLAPPVAPSVTPDLGVGWSIPLRDVAGRRITSIPDYLIEGYARLILKSNPAGFASGSGLWVGVGVLADGPLSTATRGIVWGLRNVDAGLWHVQYTTRSGASWASPSIAGTGVVDPGGVHGVWGGPTINVMQTFGVAAAPLQGAGATTTTRAFTALTLTGSDPHLVLCAGWAAVPSAPDAVTVRAGARFLAPPSPTDL